jgi:hypothetical protein
MLADDFADVSPLLEPLHPGMLAKSSAASPIETNDVAQRVCLMFELL